MAVTRYVRFTSASQDLFVKLNVYDPDLYTFDPMEAICAAAQRYADGKPENPHLNIVEFVKKVPNAICKDFGFTIEDVIDTHHFQPVASAITDLNAFASGHETRLSHSDQDIKTYSVLVKATCDVIVPVISKTEEDAFKKAEDIVYKMLDNAKVENIDATAIITLKTHDHIY